MTDNRVFIDEVPHSHRGASSTDRWRACKGSINLIERLLRDGKKLRTSGEAAAEGTVAHTVFATAMEDGSDAIDFLDMEFSSGGWTFPVDQEMADGVQMMLDFVRDTVSRDPKAIVYIEKSLQSITHNDAYGTPDAFVVLPTLKIIVICDFKYGAGILCYPDSNQNKYYGYLGIETYIDKPKGFAVELYVAQPRIPHQDGFIRKYETTADDLVRWWFDELLPDMVETHNENAMLVIGEHCRFCPAKLSCPALKQDTMDMVVDADPCHMTTDELNEVMHKKGAIIKFLESVAGEAFRRALDGELIAGYKIVKKQSRRTNKESLIAHDDEGAVLLDGNDEPIVLMYEQQVISTFGIEAYEEAKMRTIPQLEKLEGGKQFVSKWAYMPDNGLTLAANSDKRMAVQRPMDRFIAEEVV